MKSSNVLAALVTLGLATAAATPALALENQFSGAFTSFYDLSNYSASGILSKDNPTQNYFVQRVRFDYTAKATEDVKLVTKFELDYNWYGNNSFEPARGGGAAIGADGINLETKNLYLDLNVVKGLNAKIGMQSNTDAFKGVIFDTDMAGLLLTHDYSNAGVSAGFFRFADRASSFNDDLNPLGKYTQDMFALDGKYSISKNMKLGAAYYYFKDNRVTAEQTKVHNLGINAETTVGPISLSGFALTQFGDRMESITDPAGASKADAKGYAFNVGASMPLAGGTGRASFLYAGGGKNSLFIPQSDNGGTEGGAFYENEMIILSRDKNATTIDNAIVYDINNKEQGVMFLSAGYDYPFTAKLSGSANLGLAWVAKNQSTALNALSAKNSYNANSDFIGTEVNCEANYKLMPAVTIGARLGYVVLGDYYKNSDATNPLDHKTPDNPYDIKLLAKFAF